MSGTSILSSLLLVVALALCLSLSASVRADETEVVAVAANVTCTNFTSCNECAAVEGCGWCPATAKCLHGTEHNVSADGSCNITVGGWHVNASSCRNCSAFKDCKSCVGAYSNKTGTVCGWCSPPAVTGKNQTNSTGSCWEGTVVGPFFKSVTANETCAHKNWGLAASFCSAEDDSEKRKLAIIIGLSVAGGLFVLAVVATIIFVIVKRAQRSRGYQAINESV